MTILVPVDYDLDEKTLESLKRFCEMDSVILSIYDDNVLEISLEPAFSKGWFGNVDEKMILDMVRERFLKKRDDFIKAVKKICDFRIEIENGNFGKILERYVYDLSANRVVFLRRKGYNPYWMVVKHIYGNICRKLNIKCQVEP